MITGELKSKVDRIWDTMWSGGISNPLSVIEQLTCLRFIKRLDELQTRKANKAASAGKPIEDPILKKGLQGDRAREAVQDGQPPSTLLRSRNAFTRTTGSRLIARSGISPTAARAYSRPSANLA